MRTFTLHLQDATRSEQVPDVVSFVGGDASGSFGILAGHERMMTMLGFGLARYRRQDEGWQHLALPGGLLYFVDGQLFVCTRRFVRDPDYQRISAALNEELRGQEEALRGIKEGLRRLEEELLRRMWRIGRGAP